MSDRNKRREWLKYEGEKMFCLDCKIYASGDAQKKGPFIVGTLNFKLESIKEHVKSQGHQHCARIAAAKRAPPNTSAAEKALSSMHRALHSKMDKLFHTAHTIAKKGRPFTEFVWMCELDEMKGIDIGNTYCNHTQARTFIGFIALVERQKIQLQFSNGLASIGQEIDDSI